LLPPPGQGTRPVTDRAKQSIFDVLAPLLPDARVYDCFAGTGSFGLEALSRGSAHATFFEQHRPTAAVLRRNVDLLGVGGRSVIVTADLFRHLDATAAEPPGVDVVFLDPPYRFLRERPDELRRLAGALVARHLAPGGLVVFRHDAADRLDLPGLTRADERAYGEMAVEFLRLAA